MMFPRNPHESGYYRGYGDLGMPLTDTTSGTPRPSRAATGLPIRTACRSRLALIARRAIREVLALQVSARWEGEHLAPGEWCQAPIGETPEAAQVRQGGASSHWPRPGPPG